MGDRGDTEAGPRSARRRDAVGREIRRMIVEGRLVPGQRVPQGDIARSLGVSRLPVREALISLERQGWITTKPHRGSYVNGIDEKVVRDHYALYGELFGFAARRALDRMSARELSDLAGIGVELAGVGDPDAFQQVNDRYLRGLIRSAASDRLVMTLRALSELVPGNFFAVVPGAIATQKGGIAVLQAALERGDAAAARQACVAMEGEQADNVLLVLPRPDLPVAETPA